MSESVIGEIMSEINNKDICCLYEKNWLKNGMVYIEDLIQNGKLMTEEAILSALKSKTGFQSTSKQKRLILNF